MKPMKVDMFCWIIDKNQIKIVVDTFQATFYTKIIDICEIEYTVSQFFALKFILQVPI